MLALARARIAVSRSWRFAAVLTGAATACALFLPGGISSAQTRAPSPTLSSLVAQAQQLTYQINALSEQYDGLRVELSSARTSAAKAEQAAATGCGRPQDEPGRGLTARGSQLRERRL